MSSLAYGEPGKKKTKQSKKSHKSLGSSSELHNHNFGIGLQIAAGTYSGVTAIVPLSKNTFVQGNAGFTFLQGTLSLTADFAMEFPDIIDTDGVVTPYAGVGAVFLAGRDYASLMGDADGVMHLGGRLPLGLYVTLSDVPIQIFGEITPGLLLFSSVTPILSFEFGARWMF